LFLDQEGPAVALRLQGTALFFSDRPSPGGGDMAVDDVSGRLALRVARLNFAPAPAEGGRSDGI